MGRRRKPEHEKLLPVMTMVPPALLAALERIAKERDMKLSAVVRRLLERRVEAGGAVSTDAFR